MIERIVSIIHIISPIVVYLYFHGQKGSETVTKAQSQDRNVSTESGDCGYSKFKQKE
jgi:hypothetical protein